MANNKIHDYAKSILEENGVDIHNYADYPEDISVLVSDLKAVYPDGMEYHYEQVAQAVLDISTPSKEQIPCVGFDFDDWGSWGVGDFYQGQEAKLREAILSGKPFNTGWHGYKKEPQSMRIIRDGEGTTVFCSASMDEALEQADLLYDCLEDEEYGLLTEEKIDTIRQYLYLGDFREEASGSADLPIDAPFDDIMKAAASLMSGLQRELKDSFRECIGITLAVLYGESEETEEKIRKRIEQYCPEEAG